MDKSAQTDKMENASSTEHFEFHDFDKEFASIILDFIVHPFGKALN